MWLYFFDAFSNVQSSNQCLGPSIVCTIVLDRCSPFLCDLRDETLLSILGLSLGSNLALCPDHRLLAARSAQYAPSCVLGLARQTRGVVKRLFRFEIRGYEFEVSIESAIACVKLSGEK